MMSRGLKACSFSFIPASVGAQAYPPRHREMHSKSVTLLQPLIQLQPPIHSLLNHSFRSRLRPFPYQSFSYRTFPKVYVFITSPPIKVEKPFRTLSTLSIERRVHPPNPSDVKRSISIKDPLCKIRASKAKFGIYTLIRRWSFLDRKKSPFCVYKKK